MAATRAVAALAAAGLPHTLQRYAYDPAAERKGRQAADALGVGPAVVFKTLMILVDGKAACAVLPCDRELSFKRRRWRWAHGRPR